MAWFLLQVFHHKSGALKRLAQMVQAHQNTVDADEKRRSYESILINLQVLDQN